MTWCYNRYPIMSTEEKPQNQPEDIHRGHRKRLRDKFLRSGLAGFHDYEIVELLLSLGTPRRDCKIPAKEAVKKFQTLRGVLEATPEELQQIVEWIMAGAPEK